MTATNWLRICVVVTGMAIMTVLPPANGQAADKPTSFSIATPVSQRFQAEFETAWHHLPSSLLKKLNDFGWRVELAEFVVDAAPELANEAPRGWPSGMSWRQTDAVHLPGSRKVVLAEKRFTQAGREVACNRIGGVLRHELGHAFDSAEKAGPYFLSAGTEFRAVYAQDLQRLDATQRTRLRYYLQSSQAGRQETFAECFAIVLGGGSDVTLASDFATGFPHSLAWMRERLKRLSQPNKPIAPAATVAAQTADSRR